MIFTDNNNIGFAFSGNKMGFKLFYSHNLDSKNIGSSLIDARRHFAISNLKTSHFSFRNSEEYMSFYVYRSIADWESREGFYNVSVFIKKGYSFNLKKILDFLNKTENDYFEKFVKPYNSVQIARSESEQKEYFDKIAIDFNKIDFELNALQSKKTIAHKIGYLNYDSNAELLQILSDCILNRYNDYKFIYLIKNSNLGIKPKEALLQIDQSKYPKPIIKKPKEEKQENDSIYSQYKDKQKEYSLNKILKDAIDYVAKDGRLTSVEKMGLEEKAKENNFPYDILLKKAEEATAIQKEKLDRQAAELGKTENQKEYNIRLQIKNKNIPLKAHIIVLNFGNKEKKLETDFAGRINTSILCEKETNIWIDAGNDFEGSKSYTVKHISDNQPFIITVEKKQNKSQITKPDIAKHKYNSDNGINIGDIIKNNKLLIIGLASAVVIAAIVALFIVFGGSNADNAKYEEYITEAKTIKKQFEKDTIYKNAIDKFEILKEKIEKSGIDKAKFKDFYKFGDEIKKNKPKVNPEEIEKIIKDFLAGIDFHEPTCDKYIKQTQNKDLTKKLNAFKEICKQVENANSIIKEENKDSEFIKSTMLHISVFINMEENYRKIRNVNSISKYYTIILKKDKNYEKVYSETELAKYIFLNNTQRKELVLYWDVLNNARLAFANGETLNERIQKVAKNSSPKRSQEINSFLLNRKNK